MVTNAAAPPRGEVVSGSYRRILVPLAASASSERAVEVACSLASERSASVTVLSVVEVQPALPLDARMDEEEEGVRLVQQRAEAIGDAYGVRLVLRRARARQAATAILDELGEYDFDLVVLGTVRSFRSNRRASPFGRTAQQVLRGSLCRVLLVAAPF